MKRDLHIQKGTNTNEKRPTTCEKRPTKKTTYKIAPIQKKKKLWEFLPFVTDRLVL